MVDMGAAGTEGDSNAFRNLAFGMQFMDGNIPFPPLSITAKHNKSSIHFD